MIIIFDYLQQIVKKKRIQKRNKFFTCCKTNHQPATLFKCNTLIIQKAIKIIQK